MTVKPSTSIQFGNTIIHYTVNSSQRKTLAIHVHPNGLVTVDAPITASQESIAEKVKKRASWICKQKLGFDAFPPPLTERKYVSGESHRYLGRQYRLMIVPSGIDTVKLIQGRLFVNSTDADNSLKSQRLVQQWFRNRANAVLMERYEICRNQLEKLGIQHSGGFELRHMPKRWGSCTPQGKILLNPLLITASKDCIDYVITHELCHLKERNHGPAFFKILTSAMNDWELRKQRLNKTIGMRL